MLIGLDTKNNEIVSTEREPGNLVDKYAVCVKKENEIVGHLPLGKDGKFAKTLFYFLRADEYGSCNVLIKGKLANLGNGDGMQVSCKLNFVGQKKFICILQKTLKFYKINYLSPNKHSCLSFTFFSIGLAI